MKSTRKKTSRFKRCKTNRRHKRAKGGMFRQGATTAAKKAVKQALKQVLGEGPGRADKIFQMGKAAMEGATKETAKKGARVAHYSARSFEDIASPNQPFHISDIENPITYRMSSHGYDSDENQYETPQKPTSSGQPMLQERTRQPETPNTRARRLGLIVVPTAHQPVSVVKMLNEEFEQL